MKLDELTVGQAKELAAMFGRRGTKETLKVQGEVRIVVLQRGWVVVGRYYRAGTECGLTNSHVIRRWGTTEGLGELAVKGPLAETKLEPSGTCKFHRSAEVLTLDCDEKKWEKVCPK